MENATDIRKAISKKTKSVKRALESGLSRGPKPAPEQQHPELISPEERHRLIAEAAYLRAQARAFQGGDPLDDWLAAEQLINQALSGTHAQKQEWAAYQKMRQTMQDMLADVRGSVTADTLRQAYDRTTTELKKTGEYTTETVNKIGASLRKDMASAAGRMGPKWESFSDKTADLFSVWRDRGSLFFSRAAEGVAEWLKQTGNKMEQQIYQTGEMAYNGTFECTNCGERLTLHTPSHLPPCVKCRKLEFHRLV